MKALEGDNI